MSDAKPDPAAAYEALRAETAGMLNYDLADLSLVQGLQLDLASLLRLEVDTLQGKVLAGDTVDLGRLGVAFGMLTKLLPPAALEAEPSEVRPHSEARERLKALIDATILAGPDPDAPSRAELEAEIERLREELAQAQAGAVLAVTAPSADIVPLRSVPTPTQQQPAPPDAESQARLAYAERLQRTMTKHGTEEWRNTFSAGRNIHGIPRGW
jgi:hypothetical protein